MAPVKTRKRKASTREEAPVPELPEEIVVQILVRLPVKSLLHCRAIIKDPFFVGAHLRWSAMRWEQEPSFLITPVTLDRAIPAEVVDNGWPTIKGKEGGWPTTFANQIRCCSYQWQWQRSGSDSDSSNNGHAQKQQTARFVHAKDYLGAKSNRVGFFAHCDGLVLAPTENELYLSNPATGETIVLPKSHRNNLRHAPRTCHCVGLGLDPRTGKYKVFQGFYETVNNPRGLRDRIKMGMEVFTVAWTVTMSDPLYPLQRWQTGVTVKGFIFWLLDTAQWYVQVPVGIACLGLEDEDFGVIRLPWSLHPKCDDFTMDALQGRGELCLTARTSDVSVTIWTMPVDDDVIIHHGRWEPRSSIPFRLPHLCRLMALVPGGSRMLLRSDFVLYEYDLATSKLSTVCEMDRMRFQGRRTGKWKNLWSFNFVPYTESLLRITAA